MSRMLALALLCGCTAANSSLTTNNGDLGDDGGGGGQDLAMSLEQDLAQISSQQDLAKVSSPQDLAGVDFKGVSCGNMSCGANQECCLTRATGAMCVALGGCPDGGAAAACDGPEDCEASKPNCCAHISGMSMTGTAECTATCDGMLTIAGGAKVTTKLCHTDADCTGYTGTFNNNSSPWDSCCHQMSGGPHFCANAGFAGFGGYTCP